MRILQPLRSAIALWIAFSAEPLFAETNAMLATAMDSITADECFEHVEALADDVYEGREAGSRGGHAAATYILQQLEAYGLTPAGDDGKYVQSFGDDWRNILAIRPGDDPELRDEFIVVGAHYDHVGYGSKRTSFGTIGKIHNGADDNASGTSVLLETIEAFPTRALARGDRFCSPSGIAKNTAWLARDTGPPIPPCHSNASNSL